MKTTIAILLLPSLAFGTPCVGAINLAAGATATCDGVLVGPDVTERIAKQLPRLDECRRDLRRCREAASEVVPCEPIYLPGQPVKVVVERQSWTAALVAGAVGLVVGAAVVLYAGGR